MKSGLYIAAAMVVAGLFANMLLGDPVIVSIRHADGLQIATLVEDANPQTPAPAP